MGEQRENGMKDLETKMIPEKILFRKNHIVMETSQKEKCRIFYKDIVWAYIETKEINSEGIREPGLADITENTKGDLVFYDRLHCRWIVRTDKMNKEAGALLIELCMHAPYIAAGGQEWFDHFE